MENLKPQAATLRGFQSPNDENELKWVAMDYIDGYRMLRT